MKSLTEYRTDGVVCTGTVQVQKSGDEYLYIPFLNCGENYYSIELAKKIETDNPVTTAGEGLYIAFFGKTGFELPEIATHLKSAVVACDSPYATDKNDDGLITINECYLASDTSKKNMAYYKPYASGYLVGGVRCDKEFFHGSDQNKIGLNDC